MYLETLDSLKIAPRNLAGFSMVCILIFLFNINFTSNIVNYIFKGGILAALLTAVIPLGKFPALLFSRRLHHDAGEVR